MDFRCFCLLIFVDFWASHGGTMPWGVAWSLDNIYIYIYLYIDALMFRFGPRFSARFELQKSICEPVGVYFIYWHPLGVYFSSATATQHHVLTVLSNPNLEPPT